MWVCMRVCWEHIFWKSAPLITSVSNAWKRKKFIKAFNKKDFTNIHSTGWIVIIYSDFFVYIPAHLFDAYKISMSPKFSRWTILFFFIVYMLCGHVYVYQNFKIISMLGLKLLVMSLLLTPLFIFGECIRLIDSRLWRVVTKLDFYEWKLSLCLWFIKNIQQHARTRKRVPSDFIHDFTVAAICSLLLLRSLWMSSIECVFPPIDLIIY